MRHTLTTRFNPISRITRVALGALLAVGAMSIQAAEAPYYNPANTASKDGYTSDYKLFKTIGCPGKQLMDAPCKEPAAAQPAPAAPAAPKDADGDGVVDAQDKCPNTPAGAKVDAKGCELDSDGDGVVDRLDQCPDTPKGRKVNAQGCEMDKDGDGIVDGLDQCPGTEAGRVVDNRGCPLAKVVTLNGVNFDNDSATLRADAIAILDDAVATLKRYPALKVEVAGHTDDRAADDYNQALSERRAKAVMDYFVAKGVSADNLSAKGYGEAQPVADNGSAAGRAQNRRVEMRILN